MERADNNYQVNARDARLSPQLRAWPVDRLSFNGMKDPGCSRSITAKQISRGIP